VGVESLIKTKKVTLMFHSNNPIIKHKTGLLNLAEELSNVSRACNGQCGEKCLAVELTSQYAAE
jgi:hypothetical protein